MCEDATPGDEPRAPAEAGEPDPDDGAVEGEGNRTPHDGATTGAGTTAAGDDESAGEDAFETTVAGTRSADGGQPVRAHTIQLELVDEPGELLRALRPIAANGGNLLSIYHERGSLTPRGQIPVEIEVGCSPDQFDAILAALREKGVTVIEADAERYGEAVTVILTGDLIETELSDTLARIEANGDASVTDVSLTAPAGADRVASARLRLGAPPGATSQALETVRSVAEQKDLRVIEPLVAGQ